MKNFTLIIALLTAVVSNAQDSVSVLFIGNSYTYVNDLPATFSLLTSSLGDASLVDSKANGGFTFQNQLNDAATHSKIHAQQWDYVVLQGQSQEPSFPTSQVNSATLPPAVALADSVYANYYCSQALYFMTWGRQVGDPQWDSINTFDKMNGRLRDAYLRFSDSAQASVAPVGVAWKYVRDNYPTINLYQADGSHPSLEGTYLAACTFYASLFRKPTFGASYLGGIDATTAAYLQQAADLVVLDSLATWHLRSNNEIAIADFHFEVNGSTVSFLNDSWRSTDYFWDFGNGVLGYQENENYTYTTNGTYLVSLIAFNQCGEDTLSQWVTISEAGISENSDSAIKLITVENGLYQIRLETNQFVKTAELLTVFGEKMRRFKTDSGNTIDIDLTTFPCGVYFFRLETDEGKEYLVKLTKL